LAKDENALQPDENLFLKEKMFLSQDEPVFAAATQF
jgi:hypothetical protein